MRKVRFCSFIIFCAALILMLWQIYINSEVISSWLFFILSRWVVFLYLQLIIFCSCVIYAMKYWSLVRYKLNVQNHMQIVLLNSTCPIKPILSLGVQFICFVLWSPDLLETNQDFEYVVWVLNVEMKDSNCNNFWHYTKLISSCTFFLRVCHTKRTVIKSYPYPF